MLRAAAKFKHVWQPWLNQIETVAASFQTLTVVGRALLSPVFWDNPPIASRLGGALVGAPVGSKWHAPTVEAIRELCAQSANRASTSESDSKIVFQKLA